MRFPYIHNIPLYNKKNDDTETFLNRISNALGRWLNTLIPDIHGPLLYFVKFANEG